MARLVVGNLDAAIVEALEKRAASNERSVEDEHRAILEAALGQRRSARTLKALLLEMPDVGRDSDFERPRSPSNQASRRR